MTAIFPIESGSEKKCNMKHQTFCPTQAREIQLLEVISPEGKSILASQSMCIDEYSEKHPTLGQISQNLVGQKS